MHPQSGWRCRQGRAGQARPFLLRQGLMGNKHLQDLIKLKRGGGACGRRDKCLCQSGSPTTHNPPLYWKGSLWRHNCNSVSLNSGLLARKRKNKQGRVEGGTVTALCNMGEGILLHSGGRKKNK